ncbi:tetraacyldisaccharide 4'-kinase [Phycisphaerales bacterium]|nr:tetraacyldisaccharide 4'-kinase [Phycisphaerales bacterium]
MTPSPRPPHAPPIPGALGRILAAFYGRIIDYRNRRFDAGRGVVTLDRPVISVGNLSTGGTGKTPMVAHLVQTLRDAGRWPCVAMRGYGARRGRESDEARTYRERFPDLPLVAQPNRIDGLLNLFATPEGERIDCVLLDDGFQHRLIARQLDIVLIDATRPPFDDHLLPAGHLREPVSSLARAHAVVITHAEAVLPERLDELEGRIRTAAPRALLAVARHAWTGLTVHSSEGVRNEPTGFLAAKRVFACCAIGNPWPFLAAAERAAGGRLAGTLVLRDHDPFMPVTLQRLHTTLQSTHADVLIVTQKDWAKLSEIPPGRWPCEVAVPNLDLQFDEGAAELQALATQTIANFATQ